MEIMVLVIIGLIFWSVFYLSWIKLHPKDEPEQIIEQESIPNNVIDIEVAKKSLNR